MPARLDFDELSAVILLEEALEPGNYEFVIAQPSGAERRVAFEILDVIDDEPPAAPTVSVSHRTVGDLDGALRRAAGLQVVVNVRARQRDNEWTIRMAIASALSPVSHATTTANASRAMTMLANWSTSTRHAGLDLTCCRALRP